MWTHVHAEAEAEKAHATRNHEEPRIPFGLGAVQGIGSGHTGALLTA